MAEATLATARGTDPAWVNYAMTRAISIGRFIFYGYCLSMSCLSFAICLGLFKFYGPYSYGVMTGK